MEAELDWLWLLQFQKLFLWRCYNVQIDLKFRSTPGFSLSSSLTRGFKRTNLEEAWVTKVVDPANFQLAEMMLLKFIDFQVLIFISQHEEVLANLVRVEYDWIFKQWWIGPWFVLTGDILIIQVHYLHSLWVDAVEEDFVEEDFIDWEIFHLDLKQKLIL